MLTLKKNEQILCCRRHTWKITTKKMLCVISHCTNANQNYWGSKIDSICHGNPATHEMGLEVICTTGGNDKVTGLESNLTFFKMHTYFKVCPFHFLVSLKSRETIHHVLVGNVDGSSTCNQLTLLVRNTHISLHRRMDKLIEISKQQNIM